MCRELQSDNSLFIPTANNRARVGSDRHLTTARPGAVSPAHLQSYQFIGRMMGVALRSSVLLALDWPRLCWRQLVGDDSSSADLGQVDVNLAALVRSIRDADSPHAWQVRRVCHCVHIHFAIVGCCWSSR
jgi:hypothetical protein